MGDEFEFSTGSEFNTKVECHKCGRTIEGTEDCYLTWVIIQDEDGEYEDERFVCMECAEKEALV